jgi:uncharacterized delta-60 repeat protein
MISYNFILYSILDGGSTMAIIIQKCFLAVLLVILVTGCPGSSNLTKVKQAGQATGPLSSGDLIWVKSAGGAGASASARGYGITTLSDNSTVVTGRLQGSVTFGSGEPNQTVLTCVGPFYDSDIFIARYSPDGTLAWAKQAGGSSEDCGYGITTLSDDSIVVTGSFFGSATFGQDEPNQTVLTFSAGSWDIFIARFNPDGTLAWAKRAEGSSSGTQLWGNGITTLSDNSTVITGWFNVSAIFGPGEPNQTTLTTTGFPNIFIACYNPDGTLAWAKRACGDCGVATAGHGITMLSDNSTVVTGQFSGSATFGPGEPNQTVLTSAGIENVFIARYNQDGTLAWAKLAEGASRGFSDEITTLSDNSTVVTGSFSDLVTFGPGEPNQAVLTAVDNFDIFIARYNPDGTLAWAKCAGGTPDNDDGLGITALSDNSTVVTGGFYGSATFGSGEPNQAILTAVDNFDIFIARYNPDGTLAWAKCAGGISYDEYGSGITTLSDNSIVVTGSFQGSATFGQGEPNQTVLTSAGNNDIFIARFNP